MTRIALTDTMQNAMVKLCDGNIGCASALVKLVTATPKVDPANALGAWAPLLTLDNLGVYGPQVWLLWKDVCGQDPTLCLAVLRAFALGLLSEQDLLTAIDGRYTNPPGEKGSQPLDVYGILAQVRVAVPGFGS